MELDEKTAGEMLETFRLIPFRTLVKKIRLEFSSNGKGVVTVENDGRNLAREWSFDEWKELPEVMRQVQDWSKAQ